MAQAKYITVAEWTEAVDDRLLEQLSTDTGTPGTADENNTALLNAIERASADIESYALRGGIYSIDDLSTLQTNDDWTLKGLCVDRATCHLFSRRASNRPPVVDEMCERAEKALEDLRDGKQVFNVAENLKPGNEVYILSSADLACRGMPSDSQFFPSRRTRKC